MNGIELKRVLVQQSICHQIDFYSQIAHFKQSTHGSGYLMQYRQFLFPNLLINLIFMLKLRAKGKQRKCITKKQFMWQKIKQNLFSCMCVTIKFLFASHNRFFLHFYGFESKREPKISIRSSWVIRRWTVASSNRNSSWTKVNETDKATKIEWRKRIFLNLICEKWLGNVITYTTKRVFMCVNIASECIAYPCAASARESGTQCATKNQKRTYTAHTRCKRYFACYNMSIGLNSCTIHWIAQPN